VTASRGRPPRGRLTGVPDAVRHLWSLLYRALRRQAASVDEHGARLVVLERRSRSEHVVRADQRRRLDELEAELAELAARVRRLEDG
jgi:cell division protein FtsB